jgi:hypothetical protein
VSYFDYLLHSFTIARCGLVNYTPIDAKITTPGVEWIKNWDFLRPDVFPRDISKPFELIIPYKPDIIHILPLKPADGGQLGEKSKNDQKNAGDNNTNQFPTLDSYYRPAIITPQLNSNQSIINSTNKEDLENNNLFNSKKNTNAIPKLPKF